MAKYFVHEGLEFQTISVQENIFRGFTRTELIDAVTLDSIASALTNVGTITGVTQLIALWSEMGLTDTFQRFARELLSQTAPIVDPDPIDDGVPGTTYKVHELSYQWILPSGLSNGMSVLPDDATSTNRNNSQDRIVVRSFEVLHSNIKKHGRLPGESTDDAAKVRAWQAWLAYEIAKQGQEDLALASRGYLVNPPTA